MMRLITLSMMVSLDGYIQGKDPKENWHNWNDEMEGYMLDFMSSIDTFIYGRKAYEEMIQYWPKRTGHFADVMNNTPKLVYSKAPKQAEWNAEMKSFDAAEISEMKMSEGKNMVLFAGAETAKTFRKNNLIDEYRLIFNPTVLGGGKPLFKDVNEMMSLKLVSTRTFKCGNILAIYKP